nr:hypothetical protein Itr_chr03CG02580 [Ipomoea trifida]
MVPPERGLLRVRVKQPPTNKKHGITTGVQNLCLDASCCQSVGFHRSGHTREEQREVYGVEQPPERGIHDTARAWVSTWSRRIFVVGVSRTAQSLTPSRSLGLPGAIRH